MTCSFSPVAIADTVDEVLDNPERYADMGKQARKTVLDNYTIKQGVKQYIALFESLLD